MENIKTPRNPDECSGHISKNSNQTGYDSLSRSYICSFCVRGFSSAQALGGHMNIHRRDRANLRQKLMEDKKDDAVAESEKQQQDALACDDDDQDKDVCPGHKLGFWVQESNLDTNDDAKAMEVSIDGSTSNHHGEIEGLDLELRLGQRTVEKKIT